MPRRLGPELSVAAVAAFWGSIGLVVREIDLPAVEIVAFRVAIASVALGAWLLARPDDRGWRVVDQRPVRTVVQGVMLAAHWGLFFAALQRAPLGTVVLIVYLAPVLVAVVAPFVLGERLTGRVGVALVLAAAGSVLLLGPGASGVEPLGLAFACAAAVLMAALILNAKILAPLYGGLRLALAQVSVATVVLIPFAVAGAGGWPTRAECGWLLVLGLAHTAFALVVYLGALGHIPALHASVLAYLEPASAAALGWLVLDERLGLGTVVGGLLVVIGGLLVLGEPGAEEIVASPEAAGLPG